MTAWLALLGFVPATLLSGLAVMRAWMNARAIQRNDQITEWTAKMTEQNAKAIEQVHVIVNERLTKLLETTGALARSEGVAEGRDTERSEEAERDRLAGQ